MITGLGEIEYAENGTDPVATYTADDPEGSAIVSWSLAGDDADDFKIEDGVLSFKSKDGPDYESGTDGDRNNDGDVTQTLMKKRPTTSTWSRSRRPTPRSGSA